jgi:hypothetical protein
MVFRAKASTIGGNVGGGPRGVAFPVEGTIEGYHILVAQGPLVKTQSSVGMRR